MAFHPTGVSAPAEGEVALVPVDGGPVAVACVDGRYHAVDDTCTHQQCSLSDGDLEGDHLICPCHFGEFDLATGAVVSGPPPAPIRVWEVRVVDGLIELER